MGGITPRSLHCRVPFSGRPTQNTLTDGSPRKGHIAPWENHPSQGPKHPRDPLSSAASAQSGGRDGVTVTGNGSRGTPARFPPGVSVGGLGWESSGAACSAPAWTPGGHKRGRWGRVKRRTVIAIEGVGNCGLGGARSRSLRGSGPFSGQALENTLTDGSPGKGTIAPWENHPSQGHKHPPDFRVEVGGEGDIGGWTQGLAIPPHPSPHCPPSPQHHSCNP